MGSRGFEGLERSHANRTWYLVLIVDRFSASPVQADGVRSPELGRAEREALSGQWSEAVARLERASDLAKQRNDRAGEACAAASRARIEVDRNRFLRYDPAAARRVVDAALALSRPAGAPESSRRRPARARAAPLRGASGGRRRGLGAHRGCCRRGLHAAPGARSSGLAHSRFYRGLLAQMQNRLDDARPRVHQRRDAGARGGRPRAAGVRRSAPGDTGTGGGPNRRGRGPLRAIPRDARSRRVSNPDPVRAALARSGGHRSRRCGSWARAPACGGRRCRAIPELPGGRGRRPRLLSGDRREGGEALGSSSTDGRRWRQLAAMEILA